jgi:hypothetical protein
MICSNPQCFGRKDTVFSPHDLIFSVNKKQLNIKKKLTKIILEGKKPMRKNIVAIDNVL